MIDASGILNNTKTARCVPAYKLLYQNFSLGVPQSRDAAKWLLTLTKV
jgi:hypothetical protein